jgi:transcriptional regulator with GAF, ATPase, and Fis domain
MADDRDARIAQLEAENAALRERDEQRNRVLAEALEQQTATAEVLRVIASAPNDVQRALGMIAQTAARLCNVPGVLLLRAHPGVRRFTIAAATGFFADRLRASGQPHDGGWPTTVGIDRDSAAGRAFLDRQIVSVMDMAEAARTEYPAARDVQANLGHRSYVAVPLVRRGESIGVLSLARTVVQPFTGAEIALVQTFADQAVIAIENARLFSELEARNAELQESNRQVTEALDQQTATS